MISGFFIVSPFPSLLLESTIWEHCFTYTKTWRFPVNMASLFLSFSTFFSETHRGTTVQLKCTTHIGILLWKCLTWRPELSNLSPARITSTILFWFVTSCELVSRLQCFGKMSSALKMKTVCLSKTVSAYESTHHKTEEQDCHLHRENLKFHNNKSIYSFGLSSVYTRITCVSTLDSQAM
jgi:hypothetical protein